MPAACSHSSQTIPRWRRAQTSGREQLAGGQEPPAGPARPEDGATDGAHATMSAPSGPTLAAAERWG